MMKGKMNSQSSGNWLSLQKVDLHSYINPRSVVDGHTRIEAPCHQHILSPTATEKAETIRWYPSYIDTLEYWFPFNRR